MPYPKSKKSYLLFTGLLLIVLFHSPASTAYSQDCLQKIQEAQRLYDQGMIDEIPGMLEPCMQEGFTRTQKIEAYKLIIMSYLFDENQTEAEKTMLQFLKKYPEYEIMPNDPVEFIYLFESYRTASIFSFGITGGLNFTDPRIIEPFTTFDVSSSSFKNTIKPGFQIGLGIERYISRRLLLNMEACLAMNQYRFSDEEKSEQSISYVKFTEKLYKLEIPLTLGYEFTFKRTHFVGRAGISVAKITSVTGEPTRKFFSDTQSITGGDQDISGSRKDFIYSGVIGAGVRYKVPRGILSCDLKFKLGFNNIVKSNKRYANETLYNRYYYVDDDFSLNTISISAGYYFSFYSPRKQR